jgi:hypothetical protein
MKMPANEKAEKAKEVNGSEELKPEERCYGGYYNGGGGNGGNNGGATSGNIPANATHFITNNGVITYYDANNNVVGTAPANGK